MDEHQSKMDGPDDKPKGSVRVCIRVRPQLKREVVYRQVVEAVSVSSNERLLVPQGVFR